MSYIDLVTAVERLGERLVPVVGQDAALSAWTKRERAIELLHAALRRATLVAWVEIAGEHVQLTGIDWTTASLWHEIILGGVVRSSLHEPIARYEGLKVLLDQAAFEALWPTPDVKEGVNPGPLRKRGRKVLVELAELAAAGRQINNLGKEDEGKLRRKLVADTGASYQTAVRLLAQFRKGRRAD